MGAHATKTGSGRPAKCLPWLLLAVSLSSLFVFSGERDSFYRPYMSHNWDTAKDLAVAANLSLEHRLRLFLRLQPDEHGKLGYEVYSRFPVSAYALLKLAILPFDNDLGQQLLAARTLVLALFCGAAALAFLALRRIAAPWIALAATLLAFSSFHTLYYSDVVATEIVIDLFGVMLALHGMVVYAQEGRFGQLLAKSCAALLLGWHVYALLLPFVVFGLFGKAARAWSNGNSRRRRPNASTALGGRLRTVTLALLRSRLLILGAVTLLFGIALLAFNFGNERAMLKDEVALADLPSVRSILYRAGQDADSRSPDGADIPWPGFLFRQIHAAGAATIPYVLPVPRDGKGRVGRQALTGALVAGVGMLAIGGCLLAWRRTPRHNGGLPLSALALSGFIWALPMRHSAFEHDYEQMFYVGVPLAAYTLLFTLAGQRFGNRVDRVAVAAALVAALAFFLSGREMSRLTAGAETVDLAQALRTDFQAMRGRTQGKTVFVAGNGQLGSAATLAAGPSLTAYYLAGSILQYDTTGHWPHYRHSLAARNRPYDFILSDKRFEHPALLTPDNRFALLYDGHAFGRAHDFYLADYRAEYEAVAAREPAAAARRGHAAFDVHVGGGRATGAIRNSEEGGGKLFFLRAPCVAEDTQGVFFVHVVPRKPANLGANRRQYGFDNLDFRFADRGVAFDGKCMASIALPDYDIARIGTGRSTPNGREAWRADFNVDS